MHIIYSLLSELIHTVMFYVLYHNVRINICFNLTEYNYKDKSFNIKNAMIKDIIIINDPELDMTSSAQDLSEK